MSQEPYMIWSSFVIHKCKMIISGGFFYFLFILIFQVFSGVKGQKIVQKDKTFCLLHSRSQEPYIIWLSFVVHTCKMIISAGFFFIISKFWFFRLLGGSTCIKWPKCQKNLSVSLWFSGTVPHMIVVSYDS